MRLPSERSNGVRFTRSFRETCSSRGDPSPVTISFELLPTIVFAIVVLCWFVFAAAFIFRRKPARAAERKRDRASMIGVALQGLAYAIVWSVRRQPFTPIALMARPLEWVLALVTVALAAGSVWISLAAVKTLGQQWSLAARVIEGHHLVIDGPYRIVRHPIYSAMLGMLIATGLGYSHWLALIAAVPVYAIGTMIRVRIEEKLLREEFGERYDEYAQRVPAVIPFLA